MSDLARTVSGAHPWDELDWSGFEWHPATANHDVAWRLRTEWTYSRGQSELFHSHVAGIVDGLNQQGTKVNG